MPDFSVLKHFAEQPLELTILVIGVLAVVFMIKVFPSLKENRKASTDRGHVMTAITKINESLTGMTAIIESMKADIASNTDKINNLGKDVQKGLMVEEELPVIDRLAAGDRYINEYHGNGTMGKYFRELMEKNAEEWENYCRIKAAR